MHRLLVLFCLMMLTLTPIHAQDDSTDDYQLRTPAVEEYLAAIPQLSDISPSDREILEAVLITHYGDDVGQQDYDLVDAVYETLKAEYLQPEMEVFWLHVRVIAWLTSHQIDLDVTTEFDFEGVLIPVTALNLDNDGQNEWLLDFQQNEFQGHVVVERDENESYRAIWTPLPFELYRELTFASDGVTRAQWNVEYFGDVTGDGQPELVVLYTYHNDEYENIGISGRYYILSWIGDTLVDVGEEALSFRLQNLGTTWEWIQADTSSVLQLRQTREMRDNWDCIWEQATIFNWDGSAFIEARIEEHYPENTRCYLRLAENALRANDYEGAIMNYRQLDQLNPVNGGNYVDIRLAIALILNGDEAQGIEILRSLQNETESFGSLPDLVDALLEAYEENSTSVGVCVAAHDFFWVNPYYVLHEVNMDVGRTVDNIIYGRGMYVPPPASPTGAGCDAPALIEDLLFEHTFTTQTTPVEQLQAIGIPYDSVFYDDLNGDGVDDWIVRISAINIAPILFLSDETVYSVSRPALSPSREPDEFNQLCTFQLPDDSGVALLRTSYSQPYVQRHAGYGMGGGPGECPALGRVSVWRLEQDTLIPIISSLLCEEIETQDVVDDLAVISRIYGWDFSDRVYDYVPVEYAWNATTQIYELTSESEEILMPLPSAIQVNPPYLVRSGKNLFLQQQYDQIITYYQQALVEIPDNPILLRWHYLAALALEALNRPDEALAEYVAIVEAAPDSAWGMLAALHLAPAE